MDRETVSERGEGACDRIEEAVRDLRAALECIIRDDASEEIASLRAKLEEVTDARDIALSDVRRLIEEKQDLRNACEECEERAHDAEREVEALRKSNDDLRDLIARLAKVSDVIVGLAYSPEDPPEFEDLRQIVRDLSDLMT